MGSSIFKVGQRTGWTYGDIVGTCVEAPVSFSNITMLCQFVADAGSSDGDSGSPVFSYALYQPPGVALLGILWGGDDNTGTMVFSPSSQIEDHLGGTINFY